MKINMLELYNTLFLIKNIFNQQYFRFPVMEQRDGHDIKLDPFPTGVPEEVLFRGAGEIAHFTPAYLVFGVAIIPPVFGFHFYKVQDVTG